MAELQYKMMGDYRIPDLTTGEQMQMSPGKYGLLRRSYLLEHKKGLYQTLLLMGVLTNHLIDLNEQAHKRLDIQMAELLQAYPAPDKAADPMGWVQHMNNLRQLAEETILAELIYN